MSLPLIIPGLLELFKVVLNAVTKGDSDEVKKQIKAQPDKKCVQEVFCCLDDYGNDEIVKVFIEDGVDVNAKDHNGMTPLQRMTQQGNDKSVKLLEKAGAKKETP